jgi:signal transduction histidine kinase/CheY-like chemotaxis protein
MFQEAQPRIVHANRNYRKDGRIIHCEWYSSALHDAEGRLVSLMCQVLDVTERVEAEARLREADHRKTEFLALLSHELRNCLAPINNGLRVLERTPPDGRDFERTREIVHRQVEHVTSLVDDLLDVARINSGKLAVERSRLDGAAVVRRACEDARPMFEEVGVELEWTADEPLWLDADETRLAQIVRNLLGNALKFTPARGAVTVAVRGRGGALELAVRDTGAGIEPEHLERIFEPYVQAPGAGHGGGMGLGLALVRTLAALHGGAVSVRSDGAGKGAEFTVTLPLAPAPAASPREPRRPRRAASAPRRLDILIVEDNRDAAETLATLLRLEGHETRLAFNARSGFEAFRLAPPDLFISDIGLPDQSGYELVERIRQLEAGRRVFAVALTGHAQRDDAERARLAGFDLHLPKPVPLDRIEELLAEAAERTQGGACG